MGSEISRYGQCAINNILLEYASMATYPYINISLDLISGYIDCPY